MADFPYQKRFLNSLHIWYIFHLFIYLLINIKKDKSVMPHQRISVINEADIVLNKIEIIIKLR
jgi:hypothetical protein